MTYAIDSTWQRLTPAIEEELIDFWLEEKVFASDVPARGRTREVVCVARAADGRICGVCSAVPRVVPRLRERLYYYRSYVRAADRRTDVARSLLVAAKKALQAHEASLEKPQCIGVLVELENRELATYHNEAVWPTAEFSFIGYSPRGFDMRVWYFPGARLQRLQLRHPARAAGAAGRAARRPMPRPRSN